MTNTSHKDTSTNSYTNTNTNTSSYDESDDLIPPATPTPATTPEYSFEDLPHEKPVTLFGLVFALIAFILEISIGLLIFATNILLLLSPFILVGLGIYYLFSV